MSVRRLTGMEIITDISKANILYHLRVDIRLLNDLLE